MRYGVWGSAGWKPPASTGWAGIDTPTTGWAGWGKERSSEAVCFGKNMALMNGGGGSTEKPNHSSGVVVVDDRNEEENRSATLSGAFNHLIKSISNSSNSSESPNQTCSNTPPLMGNRIRKSLMDSAPMFRQAIINARRDLLRWTRRGTPLRALFVVSVSIFIITFHSIS
ncbi:hypothetical protein OSB04_012433 [Centaurea solstitialis]|uniref:Uncharacterized protein n=1 Tax=Centaurea solstitialis TaxID=347529 RepID=A0AA38TBC7_9ASTR|nr:hypothetical protein OSB04_012433 [Centaurea solstitialis]